MPITPFHFGPGLLFRSITPHVSFTAFAAVNCLIDAETVLAFLLTGEPQHRYLHTYLGATLAAIALAVFGRKSMEAWLRWWNRQLSPAQARWLGSRETISTAALWLGVLIGAWSHVWLDSFLYADVEPWWPWTSGNDALVGIDIYTLQVLCAAAGIFGLLLLAWVRVKTLDPATYASVNRWCSRATWLVLLVLMLWAAHHTYSLRTGDERVAAKCAKFTPGMPFDELVALARKEWLRPPSVPRDVMYLPELRTNGRYACRVEMENDVVKRSGRILLTEFAPSWPSSPQSAGNAWHVVLR